MYNQIDFNQLKTIVDDSNKDNILNFLNICTDNFNYIDYLTFKKEHIKNSLTEDKIERFVSRINLCAQDKDELTLLEFVKRYIDKKDTKYIQSNKGMENFKRNIIDFLNKSLNPQKIIAQFGTCKNELKVIKILSRIHNINLNENVLLNKIDDLEISYNDEIKNFEIIKDNFKGNDKELMNLLSQNEALLNKFLIYIPRTPNLKQILKLFNVNLKKYIPNIIDSVLKNIEFVKYNSNIPSFLPIFKNIKLNFNFDSNVKLKFFSVLDQKSENTTFREGVNKLFPSKFNSDDFIKKIIFRFIYEKLNLNHLNLLRLRLNQMMIQTKQKTKLKTIKTDKQIRVLYHKEIDNGTGAGTGQVKQYYPIELDEGEQSTDEKDGKPRMRDSDEERDGEDDEKPELIKRDHLKERQTKREREQTLRINLEFSEINEILHLFKSESSDNSNTMIEKINTNIKRIKEIITFIYTFENQKTNDLLENFKSLSEQDDYKFLIKNYRDKIANDKVIIDKLLDHLVKNQQIEAFKLVMENVFYEYNILEYLNKKEKIDQELLTTSKGGSIIVPIKYY